MKFPPLVFLAIWMLLAAGCERRQQVSRNSEGGLSQADDQMDISREGKVKSIKKQMGDYLYVHLAWFYDSGVADQLILKLEKDGIRAVSEGGLGVTSVWVLESREADGLRVLQSNPDWMDARVKGITGYQAKTQQTSAEQAGAGRPAIRSESDSDHSAKPQPEAEGRSR